MIEENKLRWILAIGGIILIVFGLYLSMEWQCWGKGYDCSWSPVGYWINDHLGMSGWGDVSLFLGVGLIMCSTLSWSFIKGNSFKRGDAK